jgi:subtilisin family serine protease
VSAFPLGTIGAVSANLIPNPDAPAGEALADQLLVRFVAGVSEAQIPGVIQQLSPGAQVVGTIPLFGVYQVLLPEALTQAAFVQTLATWRAHPSVRDVNANSVPRVAGEPKQATNDPDLSLQWALDKVGAREAWTVARQVPGQEITIAVVDTGVSRGHPDLDVFPTPGNTVRWPTPYYCVGTAGGASLSPDDCVEGSASLPAGFTCASASTNAQRAYCGATNHGSNVAGIAAATVNNTEGIAGASFGAKILSLRAANSDNPANGAQFVTDMLNAIARAVQSGSKVINVSLVDSNLNLCNYLTNTTAPLSQPVVQTAVMVVAAGNDGTALNDVFPAFCAGVVSVANSTTANPADRTSADRLYSTSNYGSTTDLAAPGTDIRTTNSSGGYAQVTGTSFAAPLVSAAASLLYSLNSGFTPAQVLAKLRDTGPTISVRNTNISGTTTANFSPVIPRLDLCAAVLFNDLSNAPLAINGMPNPAIDETASIGTALGDLVPSCDRVSYSLSAGSVFNLVPLGSGATRRFSLVTNALLDADAGVTSQPVTVNLSMTNALTGATINASKTFNVVINAVNEPPTVGAPASLQVLEDVATPITGVSVADPDAASLPIDLRFSVTGGQLSATSSGGVTVSGSPSASLTLSGSVANLNSYLSGANAPRFTTALNNTTSQTLSISANDRGNSGSGGPLNSNLVQTTINVTPVNDAPTLDPISDVVVSRNSGLTTITLTGVGSGPNENQSLSFNAVVTVSTPAGLVTAPSVLSGSGSTRQLSFNVPTTNLTGAATVSVTLTDDGGTANGGVNQVTRSFNVTVEFIKIDGRFSPNEWAGATTINIPFNLPGGGTAPGTLFVHNDARDLYLAYRVPVSQFFITSLVVEFDSNGDGQAYGAGDDAIVGNCAHFFFDDFRPGDGTGRTDVSLGGTSDGDSDCHFDGSVQIVEAKHPLDSADDAHDISVAIGQQLGMSFMVRLIGPGNVIADTFHPLFLNQVFLYLVHP